MDLAQAYANLQRRDTGVKFYVPPSYYEGVCSWDYCSWWTKISTPYLSQSVEKVHQTTTNKNELLRETVNIIGHLRPLCEFGPGAIEISGVIGDNYTKEGCSLSSSEKGKKKVSNGNRRPQKKNKRTPNDQSFATTNSHDQSPIEVMILICDMVQDLKIFISQTWELLLDRRIWISKMPPQEKLECLYLKCFLLQ